MKSGSLNLLEPSGPVQGLLYFLPFFTITQLAACSKKRPSTINKLCHQNLELFSPTFSKILRTVHLHVITKYFLNARYVGYIKTVTGHYLELFHQPTLMHSFLYSLTICLLHYYPRHVSSINMPIFRRKNCIHTALNQCTVQMFTEIEDTRCCVNTNFPPEDGHVTARNMSRIIM